MQRPRGQREEIPGEIPGKPGRVERRGALSGVRKSGGHVRLGARLCVSLGVDGSHSSWCLAILTYKREVIDSLSHGRAEKIDSACQVAGPEHMPHALMAPVPQVSGGGPGIRRAQWGAQGVKSKGTIGSRHPAWHLNPYQSACV